MGEGSKFIARVNKELVLYCAASSGLTLALVYLWRKLMGRRSSEGKNVNDDSSSSSTPAGHGHGRGKDAQSSLELMHEQRNLGFQCLAEGCAHWEKELQRENAIGNVREVNKLRTLLNRAYSTIEMYYALFDPQLPSLPGSPPPSTFLNRTHMTHLASPRAALPSQSLFFETSNIIEGEGPEEKNLLNTVRDTETERSFLSFDSTQSNPEDDEEYQNDATVEISEEAPLLRQDILLTAAQYASAHEIRVRTIRTEMTGCSSDSEFLMKLYCIRQGLDSILANPERTFWLTNSTKTMMSKMLQRYGQAPGEFVLALDDLNDFMRKQFALDKGASVLVELNARGVQALSFYDLAFDFVLLDAFDDIKNPPAAITAVFGNTWIPMSAKSKLITTAIYALTKTKISNSKADGFLIRFYRVMNEISPPLACGLLGCADKSYVALCKNFQELVLEFVVQMFDIPRDQFYTYEAFGDHLYTLIQKYTDTANELFESA